jgi:hypothetical protein
MGNGDEEMPTPPQRRTKTQRRAASRERKVQRRLEEAAWQEQVDTRFGYLRLQFGFSIDTVVSASLIVFIVYSSAVGAVRVDLSKDLQKPGVEVYLTRHAVNGVFPPGRHFVLLDDLLRLRAPEQYTLLKKLHGGAPDQIEQSLALQAHLVQRYASDILRGDFTPFAEVEKFIEGTPS